MKRIYKTNKGFLISEVLIAVFILVLAASTAIALVVHGYAAMNFNKNSLIAGMLVKECTESLRGLRDTNLLRFSYDRTNCWNVNDDECPSPLNKILSVDSYVLEVSFTGPSTFTSIIGDPLDLSDGPGETDAPYLLNYFDIDDTVDTDGDGDSGNDRDAFTTGPGIAESKFYRMMEIIDTDGPPATYIDAACTVAWMEGGDPKKIHVPVRLTRQ